MSSETSLPWLAQNKPSAPIRRVENKVEFLERQFHSEKLSFVHKKETEHSFELCLSICVFYRRIFNPEMQNFSLQNHHIMNASAPAILHPRRPGSCGDPGAVSRARSKSATNVFKHRRKSPWVPTFTGPFPNGQANAGSLLGTKSALYYCAQLANSFS